MTKRASIWQPLCFPLLSMCRGGAAAGAAATRQLKQRKIGRELPGTIVCRINRFDNEISSNIILIKSSLRHNLEGEKRPEEIYPFMKLALSHLKNPILHCTIVWNFLVVLALNSLAARQQKKSEIVLPIQPWFKLGKNRLKRCRL